MSDESVPLSVQLQAMADEAREEAARLREAEAREALEREIDDCAPSIFALSLAAFHERLDRIENVLGITDPTPAQAELDFFLDED